jgi:L-lactate dehydrogenase (cytochrome)
VPNVLAGVENIDMSTEVMGKKIDLPLFLSPTALQRLFHHDGEFAVARAAERHGTWFGISSLGTASIEDIGAAISTPKMFQFYYHKDKGLNKSMIQRCKDADFDALVLTVDTIVGGNRERDLVTGFTSPPRLTPGSLLSFATHPRWTLNYLFREKFELSQLKDHVAEGSNVSVSVSDYFSTMLDQSMDWKAAEEIRKDWGKHFCLKGIMSADDARRAVDIGATAIMVSNHGGRHQRGTHVLKALSVGAKACSGGRLYLYALAAAGEAGVAQAISNLRTEIERGMKLMGVRSVSELGRHNLRYR